MVIASDNMQSYFDSLEKASLLEYGLSIKARAKNFDPKPHVEITLARNIGERIEGLVSALYPKLKGSGLAQQILELEQKYEQGDWRVAFEIAGMCADAKFITLTSKEEYLDLGTRVGLAYLTQGTVSAPLEGIVEVKIKKRADGKEYIAVYYAGPMRAAGGTPMTVSVVIVDFLRLKMGFDVYDPTNDEVKRYYHELEEYNDRVSRLQYYPSEKEIDFLVRRIPIEINGSPTSKREVLIYKDLPRVETAQIRGGMCLVLAEGIAGRAKKLWGGLSKFKDFDFSNWSFLEEFIKLQKTQDARISETESEIVKVKPSFKYLRDAVAGRPIFSFPSHPYGFRIRYGRTRTTGVEAYGFNPATAMVLNKFMAIGTQLSIERPGKGCTVTVCEVVRGPVVRLNNGDVVRIDSISDYEKHKYEIHSVLFLGDALVNFGAFREHKHVLVPSPFVEEWWVLELEKTCSNKSLAERFKKNPFQTINYEEAKAISIKYKIPMHPDFSFHWKLLDLSSLKRLVSFLELNIVKTLNDATSLSITYDESIKSILEDLLIPHKIVSEYLTFDRNNGKALLDSLGFDGSFSKIKTTLHDQEKLINISDIKPMNTLEIVNTVSQFAIKDVAGYTLGARMGRPEKAKMRKMTASPHMLFPVAEEGGRFRSLNSALEHGFIKSDFPLLFCESCNLMTILRVCENCGSPTKSWNVCKVCKSYTGDLEHCKIQTLPHERKVVDIAKYVKMSLERLNVLDSSELGNEYASLKCMVKGVKGVSNEGKFIEIIEKGILRAKNNIYVNKDGTIRLDMTQLPITHFKSKEIGTSIKKLKELGYTHDIDGNPLEDTEQIIELKPQDIILPACRELPETDIQKDILNITKFLDSLLVSVYGLPAHYSIKSVDDLAGVLCIALAPHTSAGTLCRIIGFSKTQGGLAHPLLHAATRRDCFDRDTLILLNFEGRPFLTKIGDFVENNLLNPQAIDSSGTLKSSVENVFAYSVDPTTKKQRLLPLKSVIKGKSGQWVKIKTHLGRELLVTENHNYLFMKDAAFIIKKAKNAKAGEKLPYFSNLASEKGLGEFNLIRELFTFPEEIKGRIRINHCASFFKKVVKTVGRRKILSLLSLHPSYKCNLHKWYKKLPLSHVHIMYNAGYFTLDALPLDASLSINASTHVPIRLKITNDLLYLIGFYISEGHCRKTKTSHQISFRNMDTRLISELSEIIRTSFKLKSNISENGTKLTISSQVLFYLFSNSFNMGCKASSKKLPSFSFQLSNNQLGYLLSGMFDGDGSIIVNSRVRVSYYSISKELLEGLSLLLSRFGIVTMLRSTNERLPGKSILSRYVSLGKVPKKSSVGCLTLNYSDSAKFSMVWQSRLPKKIERIKKLRGKNYENRHFFIDGKKIEVKQEGDVVFDVVTSVEHFTKEDDWYCIDVEADRLIDKNILLGNNLLQVRCDGDEVGFMVLLDAFLNFSHDYLPNQRGTKNMDCPLVLAMTLDPSTIDDEVFNMDIVSQYPLEFYYNSLSFKDPSKVDISVVENVLETPRQFENYGFTHPVQDFNNGIRVSSYKILPTMDEKVEKQMDLAVKVRSIDVSQVATLVIEKHLIRDIKGNLRKFSSQRFRCIACNEKFRRVPLRGICTRCNGKIVLTIHEGSVVKYVEQCTNLAIKYGVNAYLKQSIDLLKSRLESVFGKQAEKQEKLVQFFSQK